MIIAIKRCICEGNMEDDQDRAEKYTGHIRGVWRCLNRKEKKRQ